MHPHQNAPAWDAGGVSAPATPGLAPTTVVMTAEGELPAAVLEPGDRIVTRRGMARLQGVIHRDWPCGLTPVLVLPGALGGKPHRACLLPPAQRILLRDWRARALWGRAAAAPRVSRLIDGTFIRWTEEAPAGLVQLFLGRPEILYADGLELSSADPVPSGAALEPQP